MSNEARALLRGGVAVAVLVALTGCSGSLLPHERRGTVASPRALELAWSWPASQPTWLPGDATDIRYAVATVGGADAAPAAIRVASAAALPASCTAATSWTDARIDASWLPTTVRADVRRCGNWLVAAVDGGYYAWTPAA